MPLYHVEFRVAGKEPSYFESMTCVPRVGDWVETPVGTYRVVNALWHLFQLRVTLDLRP